MKPGGIAGNAANRRSRVCSNRKPRIHTSSRETMGHRPSDGTTEKRDLTAGDREYCA